MLNLGYPPKPKPDINYGYDDTAFTPQESVNMKGLADLLVHGGKPWLPYLMVQWNSSQKSYRKGQEQTRRDAATAIHSMYRFFTYSAPGYAPGYEPGEAETCVFTMVVNPDIFKYRSHWRQHNERGRVCYHWEGIASALFEDEEQVFRGRSAILATLDWVRGSRLQAIQRKLAGANLQPTIPPSPRYLMALLTDIINLANHPIALRSIRPRLSHLTSTPLGQGLHTMPSCRARLNTAPIDLTQVVRDPANLDYTILHTAHLRHQRGEANEYAQRGKSSTRTMEIRYIRWSICRWMTLAVNFTGTIMILIWRGENHRQFLSMRSDFSPLPISRIINVPFLLYIKSFSFLLSIFGFFKVI